jgi:hypothetical protein
MMFLRERSNIHQMLTVVKNLPNKMDFMHFGKLKMDCFQISSEVVDLGKDPSLIGET